jgi:outer membrane receptor protein involved in Fe transport
VTTDALSVDLTGSHINYELPAFSTADASVGLSRDAWTAQIYVNNLTDERGIVFSSYNQWIKMDTPIRPRTAGLRFGYKFGGQ